MSNESKFDKAWRTNKTMIAIENAILLLNHQWPSSDDSDLEAAYEAVEKDLENKLKCLAEEGKDHEQK
jgi:hypothetical protein